MHSKQNREFFDKILSAGRNKKLNRREFMTHAMAMGLTLTGASALWSEKVAAQSPQKGGTLKMGLHDGNTADSYDPGKYASVQDIQMAHTYRSYLTSITPENGLGPDMADAWSASEDATTWTFELNKGASFHSGKPFTAKDAIASLNFHRGEGTTSAAASLLADVKDIKADGDHTIVIELNQGIADLPWFMTDYHLTMLPAKDDGTVDWESGDGAGPYKMDNYQPGVSADLTRHDGWHGEGAYFDGIKVTILNDPNARQSALITGDVDTVSSLDLKTMALMARNPEIEIDNVPSGSAVTLPMFCDVAPFDNLDVRLALKHAINREDVVEKILFGTGTVGNDFHVSPNMPYFPTIEQRTYDPDKAKFHLKQAGLDSLSVDLSATDSVLAGAVDMTVLYGEHAKSAGININTVREPADGYWSDVWLKKPFVFVKWGARPTPDQIFTLTYKHDADWNEAHWKNDRFNELLLQAKAELDDNLRGEMYNEMCQISRDDGGTIIPFFINYIGARRKNVQHGENIAASWESDGARWASRWWFTG